MQTLKTVYNRRHHTVAVTNRLETTWFKVILPVDKWKELSEQEDYDNIFFDFPDARRIFTPSIDKNLNKILPSYLKTTKREVLIEGLQRSYNDDPYRFCFNFFCSFVVPAIRTIPSSIPKPRGVIKNLDSIRLRAKWWFAILQYWGNKPTAEQPREIKSILRNKRYTKDGYINLTMQQVAVNPEELSADTFDRDYLYNPPRQLHRIRGYVERHNIITPPV